MSAGPRFRSVSVETVAAVICVAVALVGAVRFAMTAVQTPDARVLPWLIEVPIPETPATPAALRSLRTNKVAAFGLDSVSSPIPVITSQRRVVAGRSTTTFSTSSYVVRVRATRSQMAQTALPGGARPWPDAVIRFHLGSQGYSGDGDIDDVIAKLGVDDLHQAQMTGAGILIGIVDVGFSKKYLSRHLPRCRDVVDMDECVGLDADVSISKVSGAVPGEVDSTDLGKTHASMVAFDALIAAPEAALADIIIGANVGGEALIGDAIEAYEDLIEKILDNRVFSKYGGFVLVNSWATYDPEREDPQQKYVERRDHPLYSHVATLSDLGVDIVFAAGDCGPGGWPECNGHTENGIYGANSYSRVLTVGAVDIKGDWRSYSSTGPGRIDTPKPDVVGYADFAGSKVRKYDRGTSAAAPVVAGLVAAYRSKYRYDPQSQQPSSDDVREIIKRSVLPCRGGPNGATSIKIGHGIVSGTCLAQRSQVLTSR